MIELADLLTHKEITGAVIQTAAGLLQALATVVAVFLAYRYGLEQMRRQSQVNIMQDLRKRRADALQTAWGLLQCLTTVDNGHNILRVKESNETLGSTDQRRYYIHVPNAQDFVFDRLPGAFYAAGAGVHWSAAVCDPLYECRNQFYGFLLKEKQAHPRSVTSDATAAAVELVEVKNAELAKRVEALYAVLNAKLREEMHEVYGENFKKISQ